MATTPPMQRTRACTPPTPFHGAAYNVIDPFPTRRSTRTGASKPLQAKQASPEPAGKPSRSDRTVATPRSSRRSAQNSKEDLPNIPSSAYSPKHKNPRRVQVISPSSPVFDASALKPNGISKSHAAIFSSATTTLSEGMLPTPVKTPHKKAKAFSNPGMAGRALFQDQPVIGEELTSISKRGRKARKYNGFSLQSFSATDEGPIQIFTDSRDTVPEVDAGEDNPFIEQPQPAFDSGVRKVAGTSKRRKVSGEKKKDRQVQDAIEKDEGMVYVFRGKKVYRRFDDDGEDDEEIDANDLGLLEYIPNGAETARSLKPLTRKSIRPKRLFQTEEQIRARELEKEEEALTDIEGQDARNLKKYDEPRPSVKDICGVAVSPKTGGGRSLRSTNRKAPTDDEAEITQNADMETKKPKTVKKGSPFDAWKRVKIAGPKSKKRVATDISTDNEAPLPTKRTRSA